VSVLRAAQQQGVDLKAVFVSSVYDPRVADQISEFIQGAVTTTLAVVPNQLASKNDAVQEYVDTMKQYAPDTDPSAGFAEVGYISADLFIKGVEEAGDCLTRESFIKGLRGVTDYDGGGLLTQPAKFSGGDAPNGGERYGSCAWFVTREGSDWVPDDMPTCGDLIKINS
jgi:branched-chain amino acid transport system substrate-binding protein